MPTITQARFTTLRKIAQQAGVAPERLRDPNLMDMLQKTEAGAQFLSTLPGFPHQMETAQEELALILAAAPR